MVVEGGDRDVGGGVIRRLRRLAQTAAFGGDGLLTTEDTEVHRGTA